MKSCLVLFTCNNLGCLHCWKQLSTHLVLWSLLCCQMGSVSLRATCAVVLCLLLWNLWSMRQRRSAECWWEAAVARWHVGTLVFVIISVWLCVQRKRCFGLMFTIVSRSPLAQPVDLSVFLCVSLIMKGKTWTFTFSCTFNVPWSQHTCVSHTGASVAHIRYSGQSYHSLETPQPR